jgi:hypothetical protein
MFATCLFKQAFPRRLRSGFPLTSRLARFDREVFSKCTMKVRQHSSFHFASTEYANCFRDLPKPDVKMLKESAVAFLATFDKELWYKDPVCSITIDIISQCTCCSEV